MILTCRSVVDHLTELEQGHLSPADRWLVRAHLSLCPRCRELQRQLTRTRALLASLGPERASEAG